MRNVTRPFGLWLAVWCCLVAVHTSVEALQYGDRVEDFIKQFTSLFNRHALSYRENDLDADYVNALKQQFAGVDAAPYDPFDQRPHHPGYGYPSRPPPPPPPNVDDDTHLATNPFGPPPYRPRPPTQPPPPPYRPPFAAYPQTSFIAALDSIAKYDDLRCVPRLLCEVTSGSNITTAHKKGKDKIKDEDASPIPFLSRDAIIALLTVLNFVDDSPILLFARAAFLGYSSKGEAKVCLNAYPLCPKDADQLVNYLNNHNGGFFRFFNRQLRQQPHYLRYARKYANETRRPQGVRDAKLASGAAAKFGFASRILNDPIEIEEIVVGHGRPKAEHRPPVRVASDAAEGHTKFVFASASASAYRPEAAYADQTPDGDEYNSIFPSRRGKKITFPVETGVTYPADVKIFPDRTGTGHLILSGDAYGGVRVSYASDAHRKRKSKVKFLYDNDDDDHGDNNFGRYGKKMRFPFKDDAVEHQYRKRGGN